MKTCKIDGCDRRHHARGFCSTHYKNHTDLSRPFQSRPQCKVDGCTDLNHARGLCNRHYQRARYQPSPAQLGGVWDNTACFDCGAPPVLGGKWCRTCWDGHKRAPADPAKSHKRTDPGRTAVVQARLGPQLRRWVA